MIEIRLLSGHVEYAEAVNLQRAIWGFADLELIPVRVFVATVNVGGMALGAFDGGRMMGFLLAIPGMKHKSGWPPEPYLHSHMLGVLEEYRNHGVGRLLKLEQRKIALNRGLKLIEWTFDPFEAKNAYFNIERLGAIVRRHIPDMYGKTSSPLHTGMPTDRCVAEWWIASDRVQQTIDGKRPITEPVLQVPVGRKSVAAQLELGARFRKADDAQLAATGFERTAEGGNYLMTRVENHASLR